MDSKLTDGSSALRKNYRIITIEPTQAPTGKKLRVAAYARVSTNSADQENSFAAQNSYYTEFITKHREWMLVDIYADEGITGTSVELRGEFKRLMADCRRGLIDRILVKSISRFARNTQECLEAIRECKCLGVSIYFEEQNIDTADMSSEMVVAFLASFSQQESKSISDNVRWGLRRRMEAGTFNTCRAPYGFRLINGALEIEEKESEVVRRIFHDYLHGGSIDDIAARLAQAEQGGRKWCRSSVEYILNNERYMGDALLLKRYSTDSLPHKMKRNKGEKAMYLASGINDPVVTKEVFEQAKALRKIRAEKKPAAASERKPLSRKIYCGQCGSVFRNKTINGIRYWICVKHDQEAHLCPVTQIPESQIYEAFLRLYYKLKHSDLLPTLLIDLRTIRERRLLWREDVIDLNKRISDLSSQNQMLAELKRQGLIDPDIFISQANALAAQLRETKQQKELLLSSTADNSTEQTQAMIEFLDSGPEMLAEFDSEMFEGMVDRVTVLDQEHIRFRLLNGLELPETIERTVR